jgi:hypothetical protein
MGQVSGKVGVSRRTPRGKKTGLSRGEGWGFPAHAAGKKYWAKSRGKLRFPGARSGWEPIAKSGRTEDAQAAEVDRRRADCGSGPKARGLRNTWTDDARIADRRPFDGTSVRS